MPNENTVTPATSPNDEIKFVEYHRPPLEAGDYTLTLDHEFDIGAAGKASASITKNFSVRGPRYSLLPEVIHSRFPPPGSRGHDWHVFPHIVLERSTLPWERTALKTVGSADPPWLALLLFTQNEAKAIEKKTVALSELPSQGLPQPPKESGDVNSDQVALIKVKKKVLDPLLPKDLRDFTLRTHARLVQSAVAPSVSVERAVVMGNRLPAPGERSEIHLVSLEGRYNEHCQFNFGSAGKEDLVSLVSLANWSFFCLDDTKSFAALAEGLNGGDRTVKHLCLPPDKNTIDDSAAAAADVRARLTTGFIPLPHHFREGSRSVSWFHGPLSPRALPTPDAIKLPAKAADALLLFDVSTGMFDVSYAAAWELGRMMMLARTGIATRLYNWKRRHAQSLSSMRHLVDMGFDIPQLNGHLANARGELRDAGLDDQVAAFFDALDLLREVPFSYLAPDERMLPPESLRFFEIDQTWLECLRDGAFSIGRVHDRDVKQDEGHLDTYFVPIPKMSGVLIRSALVSGYPGLHLEAYEKAVTGSTKEETNSPLDPKYGRLPCLRMDRLSKNVLLCIFEGDVKTLDLHMRPELLHFGLDLPTPAPPGEDPQTLIKILRDGSGGQTDLKVAAKEFIDAASRVVNLEGLATGIKTGLDNMAEADRPSSHKTAETSLNPAVFAYEMIAGVDLVRFIDMEKE